jgi:3-dehydroquinate synthase
LRTLPAREFRAGIAEVIKYGIIYDTAFFDRLEKEMPELLKLSPEVLADVVARSCEIKADVVSQDETESGLRAILNFGHTIGHAIENSVGYGRYLHGEAISIGQAAAAKLSQSLAGLAAGDAGRIRSLLIHAGMPVGLKLSSTQRSRLLAAMKLDKKVSRGEIRFVLAERIGTVRWGQRVPEKDLHRALDEVANHKS